MALSKNKNTAAKAAETEATNYEVKVLRAKQMKGGDFAFDMQVNGITIYGCFYKPYQGKWFVSFPSHKGSDGKYYNYAYFYITDEVNADIEKQIESLVG